MLIPLTDAIARAEGDVATALAACGVKEYAAALGQRPEEHRAAVDALAAAYSRLSNLEALSRRLRVTDVADQHASAAQRIAGHSAANRWVERRAERDAVSRMVPTRENVLQIGAADRPATARSGPASKAMVGRDRTTRAIARRLARARK